MTQIRYMMIHICARCNSKLISCLYFRSFIYLVCYQSNGKMCVFCVICKGTAATGLNWCHCHSVCITGVWVRVEWERTCDSASKHQPPATTPEGRNGFGCVWPLCRTTRACQASGAYKLSYKFAARTRTECIKIPRHLVYNLST